MHIWTGIDVDSQLPGLREGIRRIENEIGVVHSIANNALPLHISLKMSFPMPDDRAEEVIDRLAAFYRGEAPLTAGLRGIKREQTIVWLRTRDSAALRGLHDRLLAMLGAAYGVTPHPYDLDYIFHVTLFMDDDQEKVARAYAAIKDAPVPQALRLDRFVIGASPTGALGTYRVMRTVER